jgi:excinuclease UvrABC nuclease subunit
VATGFHFDEHVVFEPERAAAILRQIPALPGVFALRGERAADEPYLTRAADLRRRMTRLLNPPPGPDGQPQSKRLNLRDRVRTIEYTVTGSEFESLLQLYDAASAIFGHAAARKRLRLHPPYFLRLTLEHAHPRVYSTNRLSAAKNGRGLAQTYGPFPSRAAAERYCDAVLDLFRLRRCYEDLEVHSSHPGCAYGEMKKCMAPCNVSCTADEYAAEARAVQAFFDTHGESMLSDIAAERERASAEMEFERAADLHEQFTKVKAAASLADELVRPVPQLRAVIIQAAAKTSNEDAQEAAIFLLEGGCIVGPKRLSTLGVRAVKEQTSVGSSLFAQPLMLQAVPLEESAPTPTDSPELRAEHTLAALASEASPTADMATMGDHLSLLRRWYYRPEKQRAGEVFLPNPDGSWPIRRILRGAARMALGEPKAMADTQRDLAPAAKVKILHEGREGVERVVPVVDRPRRGRKPRAESETIAPV